MNILKKHISKEDLSAYLDGEHGHAEAVAAHLQSCAACAAEYVALQRLSANVQALRAPAVSSSFETRIMHDLQNMHPMPQRTPFVHLAMPLAAAAAIMLAMLAAFRAPDGAANLPLVAKDGAPAIVIATTPTASLSPSDGYAFASSDVLLAFSAVNGSAQVPTEYFGNHDYNVAISALDDSTKDILIRLLGSSMIDENMI